MRQLTSALLAFAALMGLLPTTAHTEPMRIGLSVPLTGTTANWGKDMLNGITFANKELANDRYKLIVEDDKCDPRVAVSVAQKLIHVDKVEFTLGHSCSGPLLAAAPLYEKAKVIAIAGCASAAKISEAGDYIFRTWPSDALGVQTLAKYIEKRHRRLGVLTEQTDYAAGLLAGLQKSKGKLEIVSEEYAPGETDFRTLLLRLRKQKVDAILLNPQGDLTLLPMLTQLHQGGFKAPKYAMYYGASETVRNLAGSLTEDLFFADVPESDVFGSAEGKELIARFKRSYDISFSPMVVMSAIEGFRALHAAIQSGEDPREFLYRTQFNGTFGQWSFDPNGDIRGVPFVMKRIVNRQIVTIPEE